MKEYAEILHAIADGRDVQWQGNNLGWYAQPPEQTLREVCNRQFPPARYRVKPATININGHEVPEPLRVEPAAGDLVWVPALLQTNTITDDFRYNPGSEYSTAYFARGLCHATKEAAEQHARALLSFTSKE